MGIDLIQTVDFQEFYFFTILLFIYLWILFQGGREKIYFTIT